MAEYFVVYDIETGSERWRGQGEDGITSRQVLPEGLAALTVPQGAIASASLDLAAIREEICKRIDKAANDACLIFATPGDTQMVRYQRKEAQARAWLRDNSSIVPMISQEAAETGVTVAEKVAEVIANADLWGAIMDGVEPARISAKKAVMECENITQIISAGSVDWGAVISAAERGASGG